MRPRDIQKKLNQLVKIADELDAEARRRWGQDACLWYTDGVFYMLEHPNVVKFKSDGVSTMDSLSTSWMLKAPLKELPEDDRRTDGYLDVSFGIKR